jgi:predicted  nucleic acid-binding Zn-ribbon protein
MTDILKVDPSARPRGVVTLVSLPSRRPTRWWVLLTLAALVAALLVACGESEEETAQDRVCDARADIQKRVDDLAALTITTASIDDVTSNLEAIRDDLQKIAAEREDLSPEQREQVDQAAKSFRSELETAAKDVVSGAASGEEAGARVGSALDQLAQSFREAYGPVDCD